MKVYANVMVKDESIILPHIFKYWNEYPIDKWVFYNDNSTDNTTEVIQANFADKAVIFESQESHFSESRNRSTMLEYSREQGADLVLSIDADELLSSNLLKNWGGITDQCMSHDLQLYWFNVVGSISKIRQDPMYIDNYRTFFVSLKDCEKFDMSLYKYHTPRLPVINLPKIWTKEVGVIHLQSINKRFYALKQLWYKHYESVTWNHPDNYINSRYDPVVNNLNFNEKDTPGGIYSGIEFDASIYDEIEKVKGYRDFILKNHKEQLVTFGKEYIDDCLYIRKDLL